MIHRKGLKSAVLSLFLFAGFTLASAQNIEQHTLFQYSVLDALSNGLYDGDLSLGEVLKHGNIGLGTYQNLDGEMIILDGVIYRIGSDGIVTKPTSEGKSPFVAVTQFNATQTLKLTPNLSFTDTVKALDGALPSKNYFYVLRLEGTFKAIKVRSVPRQEKPYPDLSVVVKKQSVFDFQDVEGTLIIVRTPEYFKDLNAPGYHFHFLSKDKTKGGHVLDFQLASGTVQIDKIDQFQAVFPQTDDFKNLDFNRLNKAATAAAEQHPGEIKK